MVLPHLYALLYTQSVYILWLKHSALRELSTVIHTKTALQAAETVGAAHVLPQIPQIFTDSFLPQISTDSFSPMGFPLLGYCPQNLSGT